MKKNIFLIFYLLLTSCVCAQTRTIYSKGGESKVNWVEIMSEYEDPNYDGPPFWYACIMAPSSASASSSLSPQGKYNYYAKNLNDYDPKTAWVEGKSDYGIGEFIDLNYEYGFSHSEITIFNGYQRSYQSWLDNSRVKKFRLYADGRVLCDVVLKDVMGGQTVLMPEINDDIKKLRLKILEVYKGNKWKDVAISEIHHRGCCLNSNTLISSKVSEINIKEIDRENKVLCIDKNKNSTYFSQVNDIVSQKHYMLLEVSTSKKTIQLTPSHPLNFKNIGFSSLYELKKKNNFSSYEEISKDLEVLTWNEKKKKTEFLKIKEIKVIEGEFDTFTIKKISDGKTYIANGFVTVTY